MKPFWCPNSTKLRHAQAPLSQDLERHIASCQVCRETWLVASAMRTLTIPTPEVATSDREVASILMLAEVAAEQNREVRYRLLTYSLFVFCLMAWEVVVDFGPGLLHGSGSVVVLLAVAIVAVFWASSGSPGRSFARP